MLHFHLSHPQWHPYKPSFFTILDLGFSRAVFYGGGGFDPPQEVADPQKVLQNLFGGRL